MKNKGCNQDITYVTYDYMKLGCDSYKTVVWEGHEKALVHFERPVVFVSRLPEKSRVKLEEQNDISA
jgi:hypothetical protein